MSSSGEQTPPIQTNRASSAEKWTEFSARHRPMMRLLALRKLLEAGHNDPAAADDLVQTVLTNLLERRPELPSEENVERFLVVCVKHAVVSELRSRSASRGRYGVGGDVAARKLDEVPDEDAAFFVDTDWKRRRRALVEQALEHVRRQTPPLEWQAYYLRLKKMPAYEAVQLLNEQFHPQPPLIEPRFYPLAYRVQKRFRMEVCRLGVIPENENPRSLIPLVREVLGLTARTESG